MAKIAHDPVQLGWGERTAEGQGEHRGNVVRARVLSQPPGNPHHNLGAVSVSQLGDGRGKGGASGRGPYGSW